MRISVSKLRSKDQTGREMHRMINSYSSDLRNVFVFKNGMMIPFNRLPLNDAFDHVRMIPYRRDTKPIEVVSRPREIFRKRNIGMDCKKKAILLASYLRERGLPYRLIASSRLPNRRIHHVFPQLCIFGQCLNFDATYSHYRPFQPKYTTRMEVLQ